MAANSWKLLRGPVVQVNRQRFYLSMVRNREKLTASKNSKTFHQNTEKVTAAGFPKKEIIHCEESLHRNELAITGKPI